jgi:hypothetical protein
VELTAPHSMGEGLQPGDLGKKEAPFGRHTADVSLLTAWANCLVSALCTESICMGTTLRLCHLQADSRAASTPEILPVRQRMTAVVSRATTGDGRAWGRGLWWEISLPSAPRAFPSSPLQQKPGKSDAGSGKAGYPRALGSHPLRLLFSVVGLDAVSCALFIMHRQHGWFLYSLFFLFLQGPIHLKHSCIQFVSQQTLIGHLLRAQPWASTGERGE